MVYNDPQAQALDVPVANALAPPHFSVSKFFCQGWKEGPLTVNHSESQIEAGSTFKSNEHEAFRRIITGRACPRSSPLKDQQES